MAREDGNGGPTESPLAPVWGGGGAGGRGGGGRDTSGRRRALRQSVAHNRSRDPDLGGGRLLVPSALTVLAICAGLSAARFALDGRVALAVGSLLAVRIY